MQHQASPPARSPSPATPTPRRASLVDLDLAVTRDALRDLFGADWARAKQALLQGDWDRGTVERAAALGLQLAAESNTEAIALMRRLLALRELETDMALRLTRADAEHALRDQGLRGEDALGWVRPGSSSLTSDVDITLTGPLAEWSVATFNEHFRDDLGWGREPGVVYDVNVYTEGHLAGAEHDDTLDAEEEAAIWALSKLRRYSDDDQWQLFRAGVAQATGDEAVAARVDEAERRELRRRANLEAATEPWTSPDDSASSREMTASNRLYEAHLSRIDDVRRRSPGGNGQGVGAGQLGSLTSEALGYANEAYVTGGAVRHVVAGLQLGGDTSDLSDAALRASLTEQLADAKKELGRYPDVGEALMHGGKYLVRLDDAVRQLGLSRRSPYVARLAQVGAAAVALKSSQAPLSARLTQLRHMASHELGTPTSEDLSLVLTGVGAELASSLQSGSSGTGAVSPR